jgi:hypothetical protein
MKNQSRIVFYAILFEIGSVNSHLLARIEHPHAYGLG